MAVNQFAQAAITAKRVIDNVSQVIVGKEAEIEVVVLALLCGGHVLVEGGTGVGKTMFARSLARSVDASFRRIQCTSDLLPSDITGASVFDQRDTEFHYRPGPIMAHLVLVDEINRAPPRTQSAFLECMEERQVTVDGVSYPTPDPFMLIATRNPQHHSGTFPLPETELDRFLVHVNLGYPSSEEELAIVERQLGGHPLQDLEPIVDLDDVRQAQQALLDVYVDPSVLAYAVALTRATREHPRVQIGASPRATIALIGLARAHALAAGRRFVVPDDVKALGLAVLPHRLVMESQRGNERADDDVIRELLESVPVDADPVPQEPAQTGTP